MRSDTKPEKKDAVREPLKVTALFAGIGGIELGLERAGHRALMFCEIDTAASQILQTKFPDVPLVSDVRELSDIPPETQLLTAGFPCQDLSQAGGTKGIKGEKSGVVEHVFRLLSKRRVPLVMMENVSFMLQLDRGAAMGYLVKRLEKLGYKWAYRVFDTRAFGLPQRRERVFLLASLDEEPGGYLFGENEEPGYPAAHQGYACGFYWTEGNRGLGWAIDAIPTLKGGSTLGIPSPPAIWMPDGRIVTPDIRDAERFQGFEPDWTKVAEIDGRRSYRWKLIGNSVSVNVAHWIGKKLRRAPNGELPPHRLLASTSVWPKAAMGKSGKRYEVDCTTWPQRLSGPRLSEFLKYEPQPLSLRATSGFVGRLQASTLRHPKEFMEALQAHASKMARSAPQDMGSRRESVKPVLVSR